MPLRTTMRMVILPYILDPTNKVLFRALQSQTGSGDRHGALGFGIDQSGP